MSQETDRSGKREKRKELPIERGFPIERVNEIAEKEGWAKMYYRPIYTMHKWWARRMGSVFRAICLYTLLDEPEKIDVKTPGKNGSLTDFTNEVGDLPELLSSVDLQDSESIWELFPSDVTIEDKKVLDPFMGGGTGVVEASRFGAEVDGYDLNPVAWFVTKKEIEAGSVDVESLEEAFKQVEEDVSEEIKQYYKTECPNDDHKADVLYNFWTKEVDCTSCGRIVSLFNDYRVGKGRYGDDGYNVICPKCESIFIAEDWRSSTTCNCGHEFIPSEGTVSGSNYTCTHCGQKYGITDAIQEQDGFNLRMYAVEYHCPECEQNGYEKSDTKGYNPAEDFDLELFERAKKEWNSSDDLNKYIPKQEIPYGHMTAERNDVFEHGYQTWDDMFSDRQLLSFSKLLQAIDRIENQTLKEYLLMAVSGSLRYNSMMIGYHASNNQIHDFFKSNSFDPPVLPAENNLWGGEYGTGNFQGMWKMVRRGVEWANSPTERYVEDGETKETAPFSTPVGKNARVFCDDLRNIDEKNEYDAVITDPPYYDNIIYSEVSDYFYVWQRALLKNTYDCFKDPHTPRAESIVANPAQDKGAEEFEEELGEAFEKIISVLKDDGVLSFTYHHSDSESWGELLESLCDVGFEVTATYPISADIQKFIKGEAVSFDIVVVARPTTHREPISWNSLRRQIYRTAQKTQNLLQENRSLSAGDIGVIEMGRCFHEYSKHHGKVMRAGEEMTAKEVVNEIYGIIQQGSEIGEIDVFLDLLETPDPTYNDLNKLTRGTDASPEQMKDMCLYRMEGGNLILGTWDDEKRMAYIQDRISSDTGPLNALDKAQFLRYRYEQDKSIQKYLSKWDIDDELRELCEGLADATGDNTYQRILGADSSLSEF